MRGQESTFAAALEACGSPPRMRGQVMTQPFHVLHHRITPADAGTSRMTVSPYW